MNASKPKRARRAAPTQVSARLVEGLTIEAHANGEIVATFDGYSISLGVFGVSAEDTLRDLRGDLPLGSLATDRANIANENDLLVRRLAGRGLLEYRLARPGGGADLMVIEPQVLDYWPQTPLLRDADALVLSRFAYMRRRGDQMVLESPRAGALFKICDPKVAATVAALATPQKIKQLRRLDGFPGVGLLALLLDCQILLNADAAGDNDLRQAEEDHNFVLWDFHDLLFHTRSTEGRHGNPLGAVYPHAGISPLPAVRPRWPGQKIDLSAFSAIHPDAIPPVAKLLRERHSTRDFDNQRAITLTELSWFLDGAARVLSRSNGKHDLNDGGYTIRPYPSAGAGYELELYLAVDKCEGLARGFYHYDAEHHTVALIDVRVPDLDAQLTRAKYAMGAHAAPQILITITARFGRISWKYSSIAYSLILKDVGALMQTLYLMATAVGIGGCAIGITNIEAFAKMTGLEFHVEGPVGQFAIGRASKSAASD